MKKTNLAVTLAVTPPKRMHRRRSWRSGLAVQIESRKHERTKTRKRVLNSLFRVFVLSCFRDSIHLLLLLSLRNLLPFREDARRPIVAFLPENAHAGLV